jgi:hypothetical protein
MLLVSDTEMGRTQILEVFMNLKPVIWANDLSAHIIVDEIAPQIEKGKTHILIPDLLKVLGHQKTVTRNTMTMLNSIMEEGLKNVMFYGTRKEFSHPVRCGVIAAITRDAYKAREQYWRSIGFVGRCLTNVSLQVSIPLLPVRGGITDWKFVIPYPSQFPYQSAINGDQNVIMIGNQRRESSIELLVRVTSSDYSLI